MGEDGRDDGTGTGGAGAVGHGDDLLAGPEVGE
jgi:hypothetical protein